MPVPTQGASKTHRPAAVASVGMNDALSESLGSRRIAFLVFDGVKMLDFVGPAEVFVESNQQPAVDYEVVILSPGGADVSTSIGTTVSTRPVAGSDQRRSTPTCWSSSGPDAARPQRTYGHNEEQSPASAEVDAGLCLPATSS
ncbi:hypothetical protein [Rhodococcus sp. NPDC006774]|uniref:hypothetical protein n=1 Tax=Rhodococcus sp. NPDC006774 TaxID=3157186 RepID=UPI003401873E